MTGHRRLLSLLEIHEEDFAREYQKAEPYHGLNPSEVLVEARIKARFEDRLERLERQIQEYVSKPAGDA